MAKPTQRDVRNHIYGTIVAKLRGGVIVDDDDPEFIDAAWVEQERIAKQLERRIKP